MLAFRSVLGDARGGVCVGAGSLDRAECTRASKRCIWAVRVRICERELDEGSLWVGGRALRFAGVRSGGPPVEVRLADGRVPAARGTLALGLGVMPWSVEGKRDLRTDGAPIGAGVLVVAGAAFGIGAEASDIGGDGGSCTWSFVSGGVVTRGELAVESASPSVFLSNVGEPSAERSVEMVDRWRDSCFLILS